MASAAFEEIAETFEFLEDWEERYRHVIDMGKAMAPLDDAFKVPGLIAVLHALYDGLNVAEVMGVDAGAELARLGLNDHLSAQRSNGLRAMVERIRSLAAEKLAG
jgi:cysteine desulfuration protein SufE